MERKELSKSKQFLHHIIPRQQNNYSNSYVFKTEQ